MRKVTASLVTSLAALLAGLTGCGPSNRVPEWSFEAPVAEPSESAYVAARAETTLPAYDAAALDFAPSATSAPVSDRPTTLNKISSPSALAQSAPTGSPVDLPASPPVGQSPGQAANSVASAPAPAPESPALKRNSAPIPAPPTDSLAARTVLAASAPTPPLSASQAGSQANDTMTAAPTTADGLPLLPPSTADELMTQRSLSTAAPSIADPSTAALSTTDSKESTAISEPDLAPDPLPAVAPAEIAASDLAVETDEATGEATGEATERAIGTAILLELQRRLSDPATADLTGEATLEPSSTAPTLASLMQSLPPQDSALLSDLHTGLELSPATVNLWGLQQEFSKAALFDDPSAKLKAKDNLYYSADYLYSPLLTGLRLSAASRPVTYLPAEVTSPAE